MHKREKMYNTSGNRGRGIPPEARAYSRPCGNSDFVHKHTERKQILSCYFSASRLC